MANTFQKMLAATNRFLNKAKRRNEPLEAYRNGDTFNKFETGMRRALDKQIIWVQKHLKEIPGIEDDLTEDRVAQFEAAVNDYLLKNMPNAREFISETRVYMYLNDAFAYSVEAQYERLGYKIKKGLGPDGLQKGVFANFIEFKLQNKFYIASLKAAAKTLLFKSKIDQTTRKRLQTLIRNRKLAGDTIDELADQIAVDGAFDGINSVRAFMIANTETNRAMSLAQRAFIKENKIGKKVWIPAGPSTCPICEGNADQGEIDVDDAFFSGDGEPPAHPNCECYLDAGEIDLDAIDIWTGE